MTSANPFPVKLTIDGEVKEDEAVMVLVMNGHYIGTNRVPLPDASLRDGLADVLICRNTSLAALRELMTMEQGSFDDFKGELSYIPPGLKSKPDVRWTRIQMARYTEQHLVRSK